MGYVGRPRVYVKIVLWFPEGRSDSSFSGRERDGEQATLLGSQVPTGAG